MSDTYNGYKNWETWNAGLWLDNDEDTCRLLSDAAEEALRLSCEEAGLPENETAEELETILGSGVTDTVEAVLTGVLDDLVHPEDAPTSGLACDLCTHARAAIDDRDLAWIYTTAAIEALYT